MKTTVKVLSYLGKAFGFVGSFNTIPGVSPQMAVAIFFAASLAKDTVNRIADFLDDGQVNQSVKP